MTLPSPQLTSLLNDDVLNHIFYLNTYTPETESGFCSLQGRHISALNIARHTSQVCHSWRQLILQSPTIWGNIFDLEILNHASERWAEEVVKRTGEVKLSIYGPVGHTAQSRSLFMSLLDQHWHRIRRLDVNIKKAKLISKRIWYMFWKRPVPNLEKLVVAGFISNEVIPPDSDTSDTDKGDLQLFAGSAPSLRRIHCLPNFYFDHRAPWISQLLSLTLSGPLETGNALNLLAHCPRLKSVVVQSTVDNEETKGWNKHIHLPDLRRIVISSNILGSLVYLSHITPQFNCALILTIHEEFVNLRDTEMLKRLSNAILPYAKNYFNCYSPTELAINLEDLNIHITSKSNAEAVYFGHPKFSINLRSEARYQSFDPVVINIVLATLTPATINTVSKLRFTLSHLSWFTNSDKSLPIFRSLTSVKKIIVTPWALHALDNISDPASLFPCLTEVAIQHHSRDQHFNFEKRHIRFLTRRKDVGNPVQLLDITLYAHIHGMGRWDFLEEMEGLKVVYERCGRRVE